MSLSLLSTVITSVSPADVVFAVVVDAISFFFKLLLLLADMPCPRLVLDRV